MVKALPQGFARSRQPVERANSPKDVAEGSVIMGDKAYTDYAFEDLLEDLLEGAGFDLQPFFTEEKFATPPAPMDPLLAVVLSENGRNHREQDGTFAPQIYSCSDTTRFELKVAIYVLAPVSTISKVATWVY